MAGEGLKGIIQRIDNPRRLLKDRTHPVGTFATKRIHPGGIKGDARRFSARQLERARFAEMQILKGRVLHPSEKSLNFKR